MNAKFRGKTADEKWVYGYLVKFIMEDGLEKHFIINENLRFHWDTSLYNILVEVRPETIGQWTGRYDKNGNEIYFDDFVKYPTPCNWPEPCFIGRIVFEDGTWKFENSNNLYNYSQRSIEVIGNIYDNPELLEDE